MEGREEGGSEKNGMCGFNFTHVPPLVKSCCSTHSCSSFEHGTGGEGRFRMCQHGMLTAQSQSIL